jgi:general secretion pathway protein L
MIVHQIADSFWHWLDCVAAAVVAATERVVQTRKLRLVERQDGDFAVDVTQSDGSSPLIESLKVVDGRLVCEHAPNLEALLSGFRLELVLKPDRFLFRPLELPRRAAEFLDAIVRSQIDRLTPWSADDAAFGWSNPTDADADRILIMVAATSRALVRPYIEALAGSGARWVTAYAMPPSGVTPIKVLEQKIRGRIDADRVRHALVTALAGVAAIAAVVIVTSTIAIVTLGARQDDLARRITERRTALRAVREASANLANSPLRSLERRKRESPLSVLVLEELSRILPDHTYVTELQIEGDVLRLVGITADAPQLIRLIEQSSHFAHATFFAPTTRGPSDSGEHYHIEARIEPNFTGGS